MQLIPATAEYRAAFLAMAEEIRAAGEHRYAAALTDFDAFLAEKHADASPTLVKPGLVPQLHYWLLDESKERVLACCRIRRRLTPQLMTEGGNIGYDVRPGDRGQGVGTRLLALVLPEARRLGLERVLITCDEDNFASLRMIEKSGGVPIDPTISPKSGKVVLRHWIDLTS